MILATLIALAAQVLYTQEPDLGIAPIPASLCEWQASLLYMRGEPAAGDRIETGPDFFRAEYGKGLEPFAFTNGYKSVLFGKTDKAGDCAIRLGRGWGKDCGRPFAAKFDIEQSVEKTDWTLTSHNGRWPSTQKLSVKAKPGVRTTVYCPVGTVRNTLDVSGLEFACATTNASVKVHALEIVPVTVPVVWRGTFTVGFEPWKAGLSFFRRNHYVLKVNGRTVSTGLGIDGQGLLQMDITPYVHAGTNVIDVATDFADGHYSAGELGLEAFAVSRTGERAMLADIAQWRVKYKTGQWRIPSKGPKVGIDWMPNHPPVASGSQSMHAGPLQVRHLGPKFPVFDADADEIAYEVALPPEIGAAEVVGVVSNTLTGIEVERIGGGGQRRFCLKTRAAGPYKIYWSLVKGGNVIDRCRSEFLVAGPIEQTECTFNEFDKVLESRMKLVQEVDCTKEETNETRFAQHASRNGPVDRPGWKSHVVFEKGIAFRATGNKDGDWFAYKLDVNDLGMPHILEVDYPDTREQVLCVSISEEYPYHFCNNWPGGGNRQPNASGAVRTGWMTPLTNTKKTMRVLFFAGSKNITVSFENGFGAGVCGFRLYKVPEGLPALKLPETDRLYGNHCERPLTGQWGAGVCAKGAVVYGSYYENAYLAAFVGIKNRIAQLKYLGQNLAIEGVYMYKQYFPTESGESNTMTEDFDYCYILSKMYRHNGIRALAGFEYLAAPSIMAGGGYDIGDREMRASKTPCTPSHNVHWKGYQTCGFGGSGLNYLAPHVWGSLTNLVGEIYRRYEPTGGFEGLFVINNQWWLPGFSSARDVFTESEVGYDDLSVGLFEKETGVDLGVPYTPDRFEKRYRILNGKYAEKWYGWRAMKMRRSLEELQAICSTGARKWQLYTSPGVEHKQNTNPFVSTVSETAERDGYYPKLYRECGFPYEIYGKDTDSKVRMIPRVKYQRNPDLTYWGMQTSAGARDVYEKTDAVYLEPVGLDERWVGSSALKKWWWNAAVSSVYDVKPSGTGAFFDMVDICSGFAPKLMVHTWLDVNIPTAHGRESRRFMTGFAAMPRGEYRPFPAVKGVQAAICGDAVVLVNDTPCELKGRLVSKRFGFPVRVTDAFEGPLSGSFDYTLPPYGITVLRAEGIAKKLSGAFRFEDRAMVETARRHAKVLAENRQMLDQMSAGVRRRLENAVATDDAYETVAVLRDFEVRRIAGKFFKFVTDVPGAKRAEELTVLGEYDGPEVRLVNKPWSNGIALKAGGKPTSNVRTVSLLVKANGKVGDMIIGQGNLRLDIRTFAGRENYEGTGLNVALVSFRTKPGTRGWATVGMPPYVSVASGRWHHVCFVYDPEGVGSVWVDGDLVDAADLVDQHGVEIKPFGAGLSVGRSDVPPGETYGGISYRRAVSREGVMDWRDIQKEAAEWLEAAKDLTMVRTWPQPSEMARSPDYAVTADGRPVDVLFTQVDPMHLPKGAAHPYSFATFEAEGEVTVDVSLLSTNVVWREAKVLPSKLGAKLERTATGKARIVLKAPCTAVFEPDGRHRALVLAIQPPERDAPKPGDKGVVYIGPGIHRRALTEVKSGETLYLAPGAVLEGGVRVMGDDVTVCGRGIVSGEPWAWQRGPELPDGKRVRHLFDATGRNVNIRDVLLASSWEWTLDLNAVTNATVDNVKILCGRCLNDDGVDICRAKDVTVRNSFVRTQDDCIAVKWWCDNVLVTNCTLMVDFANAMRVGYECEAAPLPMRKVRMRDVDILHLASKKSSPASYWGQAAFCIQASHGQTFEDFSFEDVRIFATEPGNNFLVARTMPINPGFRFHKGFSFEEPGYIRNLVFRNVAVGGTAHPAVYLEEHDARHAITGFVFENVTGCAAPKKVTNG